MHIWDPDPQGSSQCKFCGAHRSPFASDDDMGPCPNMSPGVAAAYEYGRSVQAYLESVTADEIYAYTRGRQDQHRENKGHKP